jgi:hypothetical protein
MVVETGILRDSKAEASTRSEAKLESSKFISAPELQASKRNIITGSTVLMLPDRLLQ